MTSQLSAAERLQQAARRARTAGEISGYLRTTIDDLEQAAQAMERQRPHLESWSKVPSGHALRTLTNELKLKNLVHSGESCMAHFDDIEGHVRSSIMSQLDVANDSYLHGLITEINQLRSRPALGRFDTRQPPIPNHVDSKKILKRIALTREAAQRLHKLARLAEHAADHLEMLASTPAATPAIDTGTKVFIGHGRALLWLKLKDFVQDRLSLEWDEFNRVPVAGLTNVSRLAEMLDTAAFALLVMTAEDQIEGGSVRARENVVHEAGLFQGRLGFNRAIVLYEEGCGQFSNIHGLGHIRFPAGRIEASFEEVRLVLEREGLVVPQKERPTR